MEVCFSRWCDDNLNLVGVARRSKRAGASKLLARQQASHLSLEFFRLNFFILINIRLYLWCHFFSFQNSSIWIVCHLCNLAPFYELVPTGIIGSVNTNGSNQWGEWMKMGPSASKWIFMRMSENGSPIVILPRYGCGRGVGSAVIRWIFPGTIVVNHNHRWSST